MDIADRLTSPLRRAQRIAGASDARPERRRTRGAGRAAIAVLGGIVLLGNGLKAMISSSVMLSEPQFAAFLGVAVERVAVLMEAIVAGMVIALAGYPLLLRRFSARAIGIVACALAGAAFLAFALTERCAPSGHARVHGARVLHARRGRARVPRAVRAGARRALAGRRRAQDDDHAVDGRGARGIPGRAAARQGPGPGARTVRLLPRLLRAAGRDAAAARRHRVHAARRGGRRAAGVAASGHPAARIPRVRRRVRGLVDAGFRDRLPRAVDAGEPRRAGGRRRMARAQRGGHVEPRDGCALVVLVAGRALRARDPDDRILRSRLPVPARRVGRVRRRPVDAVRRRADRGHGRRGRADPPPRGAGIRAARRIRRGDGRRTRVLRRVSVDRRCRRTSCGRRPSRASDRAR